MRFFMWAHNTIYYVYILVFNIQQSMQGSIYLFLCISDNEIKIKAWCRRPTKQIRTRTQITLHKLKQKEEKNFLLVGESTDKNCNR